MDDFLGGFTDNYLQGFFGRFFREVHVNTYHFGYILQNVEILVDPLIMQQQITLKLVLLETQVHVVPLVLPMWTVNFGFSSQTPLK